MELLDLQDAVCFPQDFRLPLSVIQHPGKVPWSPELLPGWLCVPGSHAGARVEVWVAVSALPCRSGGDVAAQALKLL